MTATLPHPDDLQHAISKLKSLHDGDRGVVEIVAWGNRAIPVLRALLFEREPSGLYQVRCRAVDALAALRAYDVLIDFLRMPHEAADPVERLGDDAVINAAALALTTVREEHVFQLLLTLAKHRRLAGVIGALGASHRPEAMPDLIDALEEDDCRLTAERMLRRFGSSAQPALMKAAILRLPSAEHESESSIRRRRSALGLLIEMGIPPEKWPALRHLITDEDKKIAVLACKLCLKSAPDRNDAVRRLMDLLPDADWMLAREVRKILDRYGREFTRAV